MSRCSIERAGRERRDKKTAKRSCKEPITRKSNPIQKTPEETAEPQKKIWSKGLVRLRWGL
jgi:hypothetical protein